MSLCAIIPVANVAAARDTLGDPRAFAVPLYVNGVPAWAGLHCWDTPETAGYIAAVKALPDVATDETEGFPADRFAVLVAANSCEWAKQAKPLEGQVTKGLHYDAEGVLWNVIQPYDTGIWSDPTAIPALIRRARVPGVAAPWVQPLDQHDAYKLVNPFTGQPDRATHDGQTWFVSQADGSGNNVWEPGVFGWTAE